MLSPALFPHGGAVARVAEPVADRCGRWDQTSERRFVGTVRAVVFVGEPVGAGVALVFAPSMHEQAVGVAVLDGVGEVAQDVAQGGDGFGGEVVGERQAEVAGVHRPGPDG